MSDPALTASRPNPRSACITALQRWESGGSFADEVLHEALGGDRFSSYDRAFLTETFYGVLRHKSALDFLISRLRDSELDPVTRHILRLGFYQIFRMRIPHHAAVNETVNLAGRARGLVNALLRRSIREKAELDAQLEAAPASVRYSHPEFLIRRWEEQFSPEEAKELCEWNNTAAEIYIRVNTLQTTIEELRRAQPQVEASPLHPGVLKVRQVPHDWIARGLCYVQDPSTLMAVELLGAQPGESVLDACAAPGGKASYLAAQMQNQGELIACDSSRHRLERMEGNLKRLGVSNVRVEQVDWVTQEGPFAAESFDRILVDAPCSNTGVIRRRVDVRWRLTSHDFEVMPRRQRQILDRLIPLLKPGGTLVYSTCSLEPEENTLLAEAVAADYPELSLEETCRKVPHRDGVDGAFAARFVKRAANGDRG